MTSAYNVRRPIIVFSSVVLLLAGCPEQKAPPADTPAVETQRAPIPRGSAPKTTAKAGKTIAAKAAPGAAASKPAETLDMLETGYDEGVFGAEFPESIVQFRQVTARASSVLCEERTGFCHAPERIVDGESATAWCEGAPGNGVGSTVTIDFGRRRTIRAMRFEALYGKNKRTVLDNARVRKLALITDDGKRFGVLFDDVEPQMLFVSQIDYPMPTVEFKRPLRSRRLTFEVLDVYPGRKFEDLCISEITFWVKR